MSNILSAAHAAIGKYGLSVIPVAADDWTWTNPDTNEVEPLQKRPAYQNGQGPVPLPWDAFKSRLMNDREQKRYFTNAPKIGIVCGEVSGHLEVIDFDAEGFYERWRELLDEHGFSELLAKLVVQKTPRTGGGFHVLYRCTAGIAGNQKCAKYLEDDKLKTAIETRGEGGYIVCFPSDGYTMLQGSFAHIANIDTDEREALLNAARLLTEHIEEVEPPRVNRTRGDELLPGDDFNQRGYDEGLSVLLAHGWKITARKQGLVYLVRPGKDKGFSGTYGDRSRIGRPLFWNFSSNAHPFDNDKGYSPFAIVALLEHGGDYSSAASALSKQGFGTTRTSSSSVQVPTVASTESYVPRFRSIPWNELKSRPPKEMLVEGLVGRGDLAMMFGPQKKGKTFIVFDLAMACITGGCFAGAFQVHRPLTVAYCTNEGKAKIHTRLLAVQDHLGVPDEALESRFHYFEDLPQLFEDDAEASMQRFIDDWEFLKKGPLDILFIDTLNGAAVGSDENSNSDAPWIIRTLRDAQKRLGCVPWLIHHANKEGELRGASAYAGAIDLLLKTTHEEGADDSDPGKRTLQMAFSKDEDAFEPLPFRLQKHDLHDTCVVKWPITEQNALSMVLRAMALDKTRPWWGLSAISKEVAANYDACRKALQREAHKQEGLVVERGQGEAKEYALRSRI